MGLSIGATSIFTLLGCEEETERLVSMQSTTAESALELDDEKTNDDSEVDSEKPFRHPWTSADKLSLKSPFESFDGHRLAAQGYVALDENGTKSTFSGLTEISVDRVSSAEKRERREEKERLYGPRPKATRLSKRDRNLEQLVLLSTLGSDEDKQSGMLVWVATRDEGDSITDSMIRAMSKGEIASVQDFEYQRDAIGAERKIQVAKDNLPVAKAIESFGGRVYSISEGLHAVSARMTLDAIEQLAARDDVERIEPATPDIPLVDGRHIIAEHQIEQFIDFGYDGENSTGSTDITFAQIEPGGADNEHVAFNESATGGSRIRGMFRCDSSSCTSTSNFTSSDETNHASAVAGIIFGDLRDLQDSRYSSSSSARIARSGYAGESRGWLFVENSPYTPFSHVAAMSGADAPVVVNHSAGQYNDDACTGQDIRSKFANEIYESSKAVFQGAGNARHSASTDCTLISPASALGVFTVGSTGALIDVSTGDATTVRESSISYFSSRGGTGSEGGGRTIVDLTAFGCRDHLYDSYGNYSFKLYDDDNNGNLDWSCGTSFAAPTVTATAIDFIDFFNAEVGDYIVAFPGFLYTNLMLMGDRLDQYDNRMWHGFDNLYGAGRLRARMPNAAGLDHPEQWGWGMVCVDDNEVLEIPIKNGNTISTDALIFKAVIWWYDYRHDTTGELDDIDLVLRTTSGQYLVQSATYDNKERVVDNRIGGKAVKLQIIGDDVTADNALCGTNSMLVFYAFYFEDTDRDDGDGPGSEIEVW